MSIKPNNSDNFFLLVPFVCGYWCLKWAQVFNVWVGVVFLAKILLRWGKIIVLAQIWPNLRIDLHLVFPPPPFSSLLFSISFSPFAFHFLSERIIAHLTELYAAAFRGWEVTAASLFSTKPDDRGVKGTQHTCLSSCLDTRHWVQLLYLYLSCISLHHDYRVKPQRQEQSGPAN